MESGPMKLHNEINCTTLVQCDTVCKGLKNMLSTKSNEKL